MNNDKCYPKGILKKNSSNNKGISGIQWDEENVAATFHPADKDYGHMKINEPPTPYESGSDFDDSDTCSNSSKDYSALTSNEGKKKTGLRFSDSEEPHLSKLDLGFIKINLERKKEFEQKRKQHYKEFSTVKQARELIKKEFDDDSDLNQ